MSGIFQGRVAIVSGAARGIGLAVAQTIVMHGGRVVIADNGCAINGGAEDSVVTEAAVDRCEAISAGCAAAYTADLAAPGAAQNAVAFAVERFGAVDVLVNAAAIQQATPLLYRPDAPVALLSEHAAAFSRVVQNNLVAPFALVDACARQMQNQIYRGRSPGSIVNLVSAAAVYGEPGNAADNAAKAGLLALTRTVALELKPLGIRANAVIPFANTRLTQTMPDVSATRAEYKMRASAVPASYAGNFITWLASNQALLVNGQVFCVRGREVLLFSQGRPQGTVYLQPGVLDAEALGTAVSATLSPEYTDLDSESDVFNTDPLI